MLFRKSIFFIFIFLPLQLAFAADRYVASDGVNAGTCTDSESPCLTIQYAINQSNNTGDTINIEAGTYTENISTSKLVSLVGENAETTIIDGNENGRVISLSEFSSATATISNLTIQNGSVNSYGAGLYLSGDDFGLFNAEITINDVYFYNNVSTSNGAGGGGLFFNDAESLTLNRVTFRSNAGNNGAGLMVALLTTVTLNNVTFSENDANINPATEGNYTNRRGGGLWVTNVANVNVNNCTFYDNPTFNSSSIYNNGGATVTVKNSILYSSVENVCGGTITSGDYNLASDDSCSFEEANDTENVENMGLEDIADNGGEVLTHALSAGSPALDAASNDNCTATDARNEDRPADGDGDGTSTCDMGAYEVVCGDSIVDANEECDNGDANSDIIADACRTTCENASCGDSVKDTDEACDDGNSSNLDDCLNTCASASCGDGFIDDGDESCDDGDDNSDELADSCRSTCVEASCGDGVVDTGESCDDGNSNNSDNCTNSCAVNESSEDDSEEESQEDSEEEASCGNGTIDEEEDCDDSNTNAADGCSALCLYEEFSDLEDNHPDIDFSSVARGATLSLESPDPLSNENSFFALSDEDCDCVWSISPTDFASFDDSSSCSTDLTVSGSTQANILTTVDCGENGTGSFNQTLIMSSNNSSASSGGGGGGCALINNQKYSLSLFLTFLLIPLWGILIMRRNTVIKTLKS